MLHKQRRDPWFAENQFITITCSGSALVSASGKAPDPVSTSPAALSSFITARESQHHRLIQRLSSYCCLAERIGFEKREGKGKEKSDKVIHPLSLTPAD